MCYAIVCWKSGVTDRDRRKLDKLVKRTNSILSCSLNSIQEVADKRMVAKLTAIMDNTFYPLHYTVESLSSSFKTVIPSVQQEVRLQIVPTCSHQGCTTALNKNSSPIDTVHYSQSAKSLHFKYINECENVCFFHRSSYNTCLLFLHCTVFPDFLLL